MIPPTSIDGTDITGATIDGTDVQEITVDGDVVFSAGPTLPVAYSNLIAWYPFDSAEYGGSNADDVTAIIGGSGDDTAYDGTVEGATYQSSSGVTDINAGANSGAFDFDGSNDYIEIDSLSSELDGERTFTFWAKIETSSGDAQDNTVISAHNSAGANNLRIGADEDDIFIGGDIIDTNTLFSYTGGSVNTYVFAVITVSPTNNEVEIFANGNNSIGSPSFDTWTFNGTTTQVSIGQEWDGGPTSDHFDGDIDDVRLYDKILSGTEIEQIYDNTEP